MCPYLLHHLVALPAVHAQQGAPILHVGVQHLEDLLGGQLLAHTLVLTCGKGTTPRMPRLSTLKRTLSHVIDTIYIDGYSTNPRSPEGVFK